MYIRTRRSCHHVGDLVISIIGAGDGAHQSGVVANDDNLPSGRQEGVVLHTAQFAGRQARAVDDEIGLLARMVRIRCLGDVLEDGPLEDDAVLPALADQPGQVHGRVDADGGEAVCVVDAGGQFVFGEFTELYITQNRMSVDDDLGERKFVDNIRLAAPSRTMGWASQARRTTAPWSTPGLWCDCTRRCLWMSVR